MSIDLCESCDIAAGRLAVPGGAIIEDPHWHVAHMSHPVAFLRGMVILRAKRHVVGIADLREEEMAALAILQSRLCRAIQSVLEPEKIYSVFFGEGSPHAHFVLIPRYADMPAGNPIQTLTDTMALRKYAIAPADAEQVSHAIARAAAR